MKGDKTNRKEEGRLLKKTRKRKKEGRKNKNKHGKGWKRRRISDGK